VPGYPADFKEWPDDKRDLVYPDWRVKLEGVYRAHSTVPIEKWPTSPVDMRDHCLLWRIRRDDFARWYRNSSLSAGAPLEYFWPPGESGQSEQTLHIDSPPSCNATFSGDARGEAPLTMDTASYIRQTFTPTERDQVIDRVRRGEITKEKAEAEAEKIGVGPLAAKPDPSTFDPIGEAYWSLEMVLTWFETESADEVREVWNDYRKEVWDWQPIEPTGSAWALRMKSPVELLDLCCRPGYHAAKEQLWRCVKNGEINATARLCSTGERVPIPAARWYDLKIGMVGRCIGLHVDSGPWCYDVLFSSSECMKVHARVNEGSFKSAGLIKAETDCLKWLAKLMAASPNERTKTIAELRTEARTLFPGLSNAGFERARCKVIQSFPRWARGGRPSPSAQKPNPLPQ
jgi:hypothetical protein